jgi:hypothetical protein
MTEKRVHPEELTLSKFNEYMGYKGRYVYQLREEGRLVLTDDGKRVRVTESIQRVAETKDPSRAAVAARHAAGRAPAPVRGDNGPGADDDAETSEAGHDLAGGRFKFQDGRAKREHYAALREEHAYLQDVGQLMVADEVLSAFADAGARIGAVLDTVPASIGPMLVGQSAEEIVRVLEDQMDVARGEFAAAMEKLANEIARRRKAGAA